MTGPGFTIPLGAGSGNAKEGIDIAQLDEFGHLEVGADGTPMHSLHVNKAARITVRLLKTSPINNLLSLAAAYQRQSGALHGQNTLSIANPATGDFITCQKVGFEKVPDIKYAEDGGMIDWTFLGGITDVLLGANV